MKLDLYAFIMIGKYCCAVWPVYYVKLNAIE